MSEIDPIARARQGIEAERQARLEAQAADERRLAEEREDVTRKRAALEALISSARMIASAALLEVQPDVVVVDRTVTREWSFFRRHLKTHDRQLARGWRILRYVGFESEYDSSDPQRSGVYSATLWQGITLATDGTLCAYALARLHGQFPWTEVNFNYAYTVRELAKHESQPVDVVRGRDGALDFHQLTSGSQYPLPHLANGRSGVNSSPLFGEPASIERGLIDFAAVNQLCL